MKNLTIITIDRKFNFWNELLKNWSNQRKKKKWLL